MQLLSNQRRAAIADRHEEQQQQNRRMSPLREYLKLMQENENGTSSSGQQEEQHQRSSLEQQHEDSSTTEYEDIFLDLLQSAPAVPPLPTVQESSTLEAAAADVSSYPPAAPSAISELAHTRVYPYTKEKYSATFHDSCNICFERLIDGIALSRMPCGHTYHLTCLVPWLTKHCTCPECRYEIQSADSDSAYEKGRKQRMEKRQVYRCDCKSSLIHTCFFPNENENVVKSTPKYGTDHDTNDNESSSSLSSAHDPWCYETSNSEETTTREDEDTSEFFSSGQMKSWMRSTR